MKNNIKIATVYKRDFYKQFTPCYMDLVRWLRISESLSNLGYKVDMIVNTGHGLIQINPNLRYLPYSMVDWEEYDIIKTLFHKGFESLCSEKVDDHPFIISKLGSVVGSNEDIEGVHFYNEERDSLYETQEKIDRKSKYITVLTEPSKVLWENEFGRNNNLLMIPTGVDSKIPQPHNNPYRDFNQKIAVYIGNIYSDMQKEINLLWQNRLNSLGRLLRKQNIRLCFVGSGNVDTLNPDFVTYLGSVENDAIWDYQTFADVGIILAQGKKQDNESSKLYYYLRTGLPVVSEDPVPNNYLINEANLGFIARYKDDLMMADMIEDAIYRKWEKKEAIQYIINNHSWDIRAKVYESIIKKDFNLNLN